MISLCRCAHPVSIPTEREFGTTLGAMGTVCVFDAKAAPKQGTRG
ncbi:MAG: hypothetical protein WA125_14680 [Desulfosporosinus sp.]